MTDYDKLYIKDLPITDNSKSRIYEAWIESDDSDDEIIEINK